VWFLGLFILLYQATLARPNFYETKASNGNVGIGTTTPQRASTEENNTASGVRSFMNIEEYTRTRKEILHEIIDIFLKKNEIDSAESVMSLTTEILSALHELENKVKKNNFIESVLN